ncbi:MAG: sigma-70 family RNA polymerase sigma factor [Melioribacteraceae bacterium]|nr:hypothetical protein [Ignavibacteriota bacterium]MBZ0182173.1 sigma-70 family RNA polymerase sigma factor [Melioribacteraceae bacterium]
MISLKDKKEFGELVKANMKRAYFAALGFVGNHDDAVEISQKAFIAAYRNYHKYDRSKNFYTWFYKILKNLSLNMIRDRKKIESLDFIEAKDEDVFKSVESNELAAKIEKALFTLNDNERSIFILKEFENYSYKEIAELMEIPIGTVMSKLFYARKKLSEKLRGMI